MTKTSDNNPDKTSTFAINLSKHEQTHPVKKGDLPTEALNIATGHKENPLP